MKKEKDKAINISKIINLRNNIESKKEIFLKIIKNNYNFANNINIMEELSKMNEVFKIIKKINENNYSMNENKKRTRKKRKKKFI